MNHPAIAGTPPRLRAPRGVALAGLATSMFLVVLDAAMVNTAGLGIREGLGLSAAELTFVATSYLVAFAGLLLLGGRLADVLGGRRLYLTGMAVFLVACAVCALAPGAPVLIAGRVLQGIGAALVVPSALALALALSPSPEQRTRVVGIWGAVAGAGGLLGLALGGTLTQVLGWQSVFWAPVAVGALGAAVVVRSIPDLPGRAGRFDLPGALSITAGISALAYGVVTAAEVGWTDPGAVVAVVAGPALLVVFVAVERRSSHPLVPLAIFRTGPVARVSAVVMLVGATSASMFFFLPLYLQQVRGMDAQSAGLALAPAAFSLIVGSALAPLLARVLGLRRAGSAGLLLLLAGFAWLTLNPATGGFSVDLVATFVLLGGGGALALVNTIAIAVRDSADGESGLLSGLINAAQQVGGAVGLATLSGIAIGAAGARDEIDFTTAFAGQAALVGIALVLSLAPDRRARPAR